LFLETRDKVLAELRVSLDDVRGWHDRGWLPFEPVQLEELDPDHIGALIFVRNAARSGLPHALLDTLFREFPSTYLPNPARLAYSFTFGWVESAPVPDPSDSPDLHELITEHLDDWLELLAENSEVDELKALAARVAELLQKIDEDAQHSEATDE